jgi:carbamoyltransferase
MEKSMYEVLDFEFNKVVDALCDGYVGAIARGRAEVGPRALGNRSIIADPRNLAVKDRINGMIKKREAYRPLSPLCLKEYFNEYFVPLKTLVNYNYMSYAVECRDKCRSSYPSIVHADGTARVQLVDQEEFPFLHKLLTLFHRKSGVGMLINTSFNGLNEPIVDNLDHALAALKALDLDFLCVGDYYISRIK